jgi:hypothetical protein
VKGAHRPRHRRRPRQLEYLEAYTPEATGPCHGNRPHLGGITRRDGSRHCVRCRVELLPPDPSRAWGQDNAGPGRG